MLTLAVLLQDRENRNEGIIPLTIREVRQVGQIELIEVAPINRGRNENVLVFHTGVLLELHILANKSELIRARDFIGKHRGIHGHS